LSSIFRYLFIYAKIFAHLVQILPAQFVSSPEYPIHLVEASRRLTYEAAKLKVKYSIAYADCFAAVLALSLNAIFVIGDPEF